VIADEGATGKVTVTVGARARQALFEIIDVDALGGVREGDDRREGRAQKPPLPSNSSRAVAPPYTNTISPASSQAGSGSCFST